MNQRPLNPKEQTNLEKVRSAVGDFALLFITATGLQKSILDATLPLRTLLKEKGVHDFNSQLQGPDNKVVLPVRFVSDSKLVDTRCSLYRPLTKQGDPRLWPYGLVDHCSPDDVFAIFCYENKIHFINLTVSSLDLDFSYYPYSDSKTDIEPRILVLAETPRQNSAISLLAEIEKCFSSTAKNLLAKLRKIADAGPLESVCRGDTSVGRSIETALGISINSNKNPDYQGIEIKSHRSTKPRTGLITLFAKTPDWSRSQVKNSKDYLAIAGYEKNGIRRLYCSVYASKQNSQRLQLNLNQTVNDLEEIHYGSAKQVIAVWAVETLHNEFRNKHNETFWISAETELIRGREYFRLQSIIHTTKPLVTQFDSLIVQGQICLDHTIKEKAGRVVDKGYLFRIRNARMPELFAGKPRRYDLL
jgi:hypothetical protein